jgi:hypothetical protein
MQNKFHLQTASRPLFQFQLSNMDKGNFSPGRAALPNRGLVVCRSRRWAAGERLEYRAPSPLPPGSVIALRYSELDRVVRHRRVEEFYCLGCFFFFCLLDRMLGYSPLLVELARRAQSNTGLLPFIERGWSVTVHQSMCQLFFAFFAPNIIHPLIEIELERVMHGHLSQYVETVATARYMIQFLVL